MVSTRSASDSSMMNQTRSPWPSLVLQKGILVRIETELIPKKPSFNIVILRCPGSFLYKRCLGSHHLKATFHLNQTGLG